jgi:hypothetical protein
VVLNINIELSPHADRRAVHDDLAALASALRGAIGTGQGPRRIQHSKAEATPDSGSDEVAFAQGDDGIEPPPNRSQESEPIEQ